MENLFKTLAEQIHLPDEVMNSSAFKNAEIQKVEVNTKRKTYHFFLLFDYLLPIHDFKTLSSLLKVAFEEIAETKLSLSVRSLSFDDELLNDYYQEIFNYPECSSPSFTNIFKKFKLKKEDKLVKLMLTDFPSIERLAADHLPIINSLFQDFGFSDSKIIVEIDEEKTKESLALRESSIEKVFVEKNPSLKEVANANPIKEKKVKKISIKPKADGIQIGRVIKVSEKATQMSDVVNPENGIVFEGFIFKSEVKEFTNKTTGKVSYLLEIGITDYSSSFYAQKWARGNDKESFDEIKKGLWVRVRGNLEMDSFKHELVLKLDSLQELAGQKKRRDSAEEKRVEFHAHSNLSTMDALPAPAALVKQAADFGHPGIAITDHAGVQSFPEAYSAGKKAGIKIIYGLEANLVDDIVPIVYNESSADLFESNYVVFDVETTGLSANCNKLIQVAASKMYKGNVIEEFDEFIDPGFSLSEFTTELTGITDAHLLNAKPLKEVLESFQKFCEGSILVAHNATFDMGFMNMNYLREGLEQISQPVIDTLEFSRLLYPEQKRHGLASITKRFGVSLEHHHMANFDAEATGRILFLFLNEVRERPGLGFSDLLELNEKLIDKENSYKHATIKHITLYAQTEEGLKNLFKIVSHSNIDYLHGVPRVPLSLLEKHRKGIMLGTACAKGELFNALLNHSDERVLEIAGRYDFIEVQAPSCYLPLIAGGNIPNSSDLESLLEKLINIGESLGKPVIATGNVHYLDPSDELFREIIIRGQGKGAEINRRMGRGEYAQPLPLPKVHFRTTQEMLEEFSFLDEKKAKEIVIKNPNKLLEEFEELVPVRTDLYTPYMEGAEEDVVRITYEIAHKMYGNPLPDIIDKRLEKELRSIVGNGYAGIYLISQRLVHNSNKRGYVVGSRGSVGSSLAATMLGISEVNPLSPHYLCKKCQYFEIFEDGRYGSGFDMPEKQCPNCGERLNKDGQAIPFETFLGFKGDKVPDIDLNFSSEDQPEAHLDVRRIFGESNAFKAGTIQTVADKTAFGYVKGYAEDYNKYYNQAEKERLAIGSAGVKRSTGQHPGGVIVIPDYMDVYDFTPIQYPADDINAVWKTTHFDFHAIHDNILKLDILGHVVPTMIKMFQAVTGIAAEDIPLDDPEVIELFRSTKPLGITAEQAMTNIGTYGIPESGTVSSMRMISESKPKSFADLMQIAGLSHGTDVWTGNAKDIIQAGIADLSSVIGCRDDIMTYLIQKGLDKTISFKIMEDVRKGLWANGILSEEKIAEYTKLMKEHDVPQWYIDSCAKIKYMFPKGHAAAYSIMTIRVAWFKVHRPMAYYCVWFTLRAEAFDMSIMTAPLIQLKAKIKEFEGRRNDRNAPLSPKESNLLDALQICNEMRERGFNFGQIDLYKSDAENFIIQENLLIPPFRILDGLGSTAAKTVIDEREKGEFLSKKELKNRTKLTQTNIEQLDQLGVLAG
ncbi:MAG: PolC-type DNA polymerase III, partial [Lactovum sp.]